ncbi:MAG TPA: prephenate dehydrogenase [Candidatus Onthocola gallistercoris]|uniref:Prephenate dehydrogenase n=1 Tax=Candidatus Onthocola gallistercoris TaxID=2840876 RepID=A0A9D1KW23_9FIRM|nr:prephenate dehydrogenase [Candidatus Onthocola gallistercoris]
MKKTLTIGFIGLGLIGGSIAKALRQARPDDILIAYDKNKEGLIQAMADNTINQATDTIGSAFSDCDVVFLCTPVSTCIEYLQPLKSILSPDCILTDVGSVKSAIHQAVEQVGLSDHFIGGHPMTGSEKSGYSHSKAHLLENAYYILTPCDETDSYRHELMLSLVRAMNALPITLNYKEHDRITAAISHLPHIIAYTLVNLVRETDNPEGMMRLLAAGGFKDITRIASSSPEMWQQICFENQDSILNVLSDYEKRMYDIGNAIRNRQEDALLDAFTKARDYRNDIPVSHAKGAIEPSYEIFVDIIDESGAIATIATILATNGISIRNIGIVHNREFQEGVLHIEFYEQEASEKAAGLLDRFHYVVHTVG